MHPVPTFTRDTVRITLNKMDKEARLQIKKLTEHHRRSCRAYDDICNGLGRLAEPGGEGFGPYLPVAIFKDLELKSVPDDKIIRQLTSSGTTGQKVSRIFLDAETSSAQQRALCDIVGEYIGEKRIPMLIIDSPDVLRDRTKYSARGAGIMGFSMMASKRFYALTNDMEPDWESIEEFSKLAAEGPTFAFGFTYMIWAYFYEAIKNSGRQVNLQGCFLIHGGGWKKLQDRRVSDEEFKTGLKEVCGIDKISDYYGMAEQTGSIFMQCPAGHLHVSGYSDISILDPQDFSRVPTGEWGLIALDSTLPESYPGHRLMTEDWGRILGEDDCPCGRPGKYFEIQGRISKAEIRGCSDTFEGAKPAHPAGSGFSDRSEGIQVLAGEYPVAGDTTDCFSDSAVQFIDELSELFRKSPEFRQYPEINSLGFWCRGAHIEKLAGRQYASATTMEALGLDGDEYGWEGIGRVLHIAPSNMPTMFAYSWITSLLAGNSNIVRLSEKPNEVTDMVLEGIRRTLEKPEYADIRRNNAFVRFPRGHRVLEDISGQVQARIIWGGDDTVRTICEVPKAQDCIDITFPDKYSIAVLAADEIAEMDDVELRQQAHLFYNDTYGADQNACSSPRTVFWLGSDEECKTHAKERWWNAVAEEAEKYDLQPWMATEKYRMLCCAYGENEGLETVKAWGNRLYVVPCRVRDYESLLKPDGRMGLFYETDISSIGELLPLLGDKIQTIVYRGKTGVLPEDIYSSVREANCPGVDRVVAIGEALDFDTVWDRKDLIRLLSR